MEYVRLHNTDFRLKRARKSVSAYWTLVRAIRLNARYYTPELALETPRAWTAFVHEVRHLQQGPLEALSIHGELDAWQLEFRLLRRLLGVTLHPALEDLLNLPLNEDRSVLRRARELMTKFAGPAYGAWILPLYAIPHELRYWLTRRACSRPTNLSRIFNVSQRELMYDSGIIQRGGCDKYTAGHP